MKNKLLILVLIIAVIAVGIYAFWQPRSELKDDGSGFSAAFLNVGKADCIIITSENFHMMIDTGTEDTTQVIQNYCKRHNIDSFDYLLLTHLDQDHIGGVPFILENYSIGKIIQPDYTKDTKEYDAYIEALTKAGMEPLVLKQEGDIALDNGSGNGIHLYPPKEEEYEQSNDYSIVTAVTYGEHSFLLMGDAEKERMQEIMDINPGIFTVVKVPHHGDYRKSLEQLLDQTSPEYCIVSTSEANLEEKLTACLDNLGITAYYTFNGTVIIRSDGKNMTIIQ